MPALIEEVLSVPIATLLMEGEGTGIGERVPSENPWFGSALLERGPDVRAPEGVSSWPVVPGLSLHALSPRAKTRRTNCDDKI